MIEEVKEIEYTTDLSEKLNDRLYDSGYPRISEKLLIANIREINESKKNIVYIKETLETFYPNCWEFIEVYPSISDFDFLLELGKSRYNKVYYKILIHFPELIVESQDGNKQRIKDLFVKIDLKYNLSGIAEKYIEGLRTTYTLAEVDSNYKFSHLAGSCEGINSSYWSSFCLGVTDYSSTATFLKDSFDKDSFYLFIQQLKDYLSYESISGTPYRYIRNIKEGVPDNSNERYPSQDEVNAIVDEYLKLNVIPSSSLLSNSQHYMINVYSDETFLIDLAKVCVKLDETISNGNYTSQFTTDFDSVTKTRIVNNKALRQTRIEKWEKTLKNYNMKFKDKIFNYTIINKNTTNEVEENKNQILIATHTLGQLIISELNKIINGNQ